MPEDPALSEYLAGASIASEVSALRPDYRVLLIAVSGIEPSPGDAASEALLLSAEESARAALEQTPLTELPHVAAWRDAFRSFGAKPQRTRCSLEALLRRAPNGLPRVNRLTDLYNAISVLHQVPIGGEDLDRYVGPPALVRATGAEDFDTTAEGAEIIEHPDPGEVVWRDDAGVTCRRWNWRQCRRTALSDQTTSALFILDALKAMTDFELEAAGAALLEQLSASGELRTARRLVRA